MSDQSSPGNFWRNLRESDAGAARTALRAVRNLTRRLRGGACCGHPGDPGC